MTIPVQWYDEDFYICRTIEDAIEKLSPKPQEKPAGCEYPYCSCGKTCPGLFPAEQESHHYLCRCDKCMESYRVFTQELPKQESQQGEVCPRCEDDKKIWTGVSPNHSRFSEMFMECPDCNGTGREDS